VAIRDIQTIIERYPRLVAHMVSESMGYFTPREAADALIQYKSCAPYCCGWYVSIALHGKECSKEHTLQAILEVGRDVVSYAVRNRHGHQDCLPEYKQAQRLVAAELKGKRPLFASR
jgi:hypothetical protein